jgi:VanZ family protein
VTRLFLGLVALVAYGSLYPFDFNFARDGGAWPFFLLRWTPHHLDRFLARDVTLNILLYVPVGLSAFLMLARRRWAPAAAPLAVFLAFALSTAVEVLQVYVPGRNPNFSDIACNTVGGLAGAWIALCFRPAIEQWLRPAAAVEARPAAVLLAAWAVTQWYPFFPALNQTQLFAALRALAGGPLHLLGVFGSAAEWVAAALALSAIRGRLRPVWLAVPAVWVAGRLLIAARTVTPDEAAGAALAVLVWAVVPAAARVRVGAVLLGAVIVAGALAPFRFSSSAAPFHWIPFKGAFEADRQAAVVIMARKAFDYGAEIWLLRRAGLSPALSALSVSAALLVLECVQRFTPGRTAEITDPVLALMMCLGLRRPKLAGGIAAAAGSRRA